MLRINFKLIKIVVMVGALMLSIGFMYKIKAERESELMYVQDFHNDKVIVVEGWNRVQLNKILEDFKKVHPFCEYAPFVVNIQTIKSNKHQLVFPNDIHPVLFVNLINYLVYPVGFTDSSIVVGQATITLDYHGLNRSLIGQNAIFYVPKNNKKQDIIDMVVSNQAHFELSLSSGQWKKIN